MDFVTVSPKFKVVIPRVIRQALGLRPRQNNFAVAPFSLNALASVIRCEPLRVGAEPHLPIRSEAGGGTA